MKMLFSEMPFIVNEDLCLAIVDKRITCDMEEELKYRNIQIIKTIGCEKCYDAIKFHPDIVMCNLGLGKIVIAPNVYNHYYGILKKYGFEVIKGTNYVKDKYPYNIHYNIAIFGKFAMHNFQYTDKKILEFIENEKLIKINVNQGYTKCCVCIVDDNSIITSDEGIYKEAIKYKLDCLLIHKGDIDLFELDYGFIGGCTGIIGKNKIAFCGDITKHPSYNEICNFLHKKNKEIIILSKEKLLDLGSIIPLMTRKE